VVHFFFCICSYISHTRPDPITVVLFFFFSWSFLRLFLYFSYNFLLLLKKRKDQENTYANTATAGSLLLAPRSLLPGSRL